MDRCNHVDSAFTNFKKSFKDRNLTECCSFLREIYSKYKGKFLHIVLVRNCLPNPVSYQFNKDIYIFIVRILMGCIESVEKVYDNDIDFRIQLQELLLMYHVIYDGRIISKTIAAIPPDTIDTITHNGLNIEKIIGVFDE